MGDEIKRLKRENATLRVSWGDVSTTSTSSNVDVSKMQNKIDALFGENKRLESERTQIIADKIAAEVRYSREKQEKEQLKKQLEILRATPEALRQ